LDSQYWILGGREEHAGVESQVDDYERGRGQSGRLGEKSKTDLCRATKFAKGNESTRLKLRGVRASANRNGGNGYSKKEKKRVKEIARLAVRERGERVKPVGAPIRTLELGLREAEIGMVLGGQLDKKGTKTNEAKKVPAEARLNAPKGLNYS